MRVLLPFLILVSALGLVACSSSKSASTSGGSVLHFTGRDETETNFRARLRQIHTANPAGIAGTCSQIKGLSPKDAAQATATSTTLDPKDVPGAIAKPGQTATQADLEKAAVIFQDECTKMGL